MKTNRNTRGQTKIASVLCHQVSINYMIYTTKCNQIIVFKLTQEDIVFGVVLITVTEWFINRGLTDFAKEWFEYMQNKINADYATYSFMIQLSLKNQNNEKFDYYLNKLRSVVPPRDIETAYSPIIHYLKEHNHADLLYKVNNQLKDIFATSKSQITKIETKEIYNILTYKYKSQIETSIKQQDMEAFTDVVCNIIQSNIVPSMDTCTVIMNTLQKLRSPDSLLLISFWKHISTKQMPTQQIIEIALDTCIGNNLVDELDHVLEVLKKSGNTNNEGYVRAIDMFLKRGNLERVKKVVEDMRDIGICLPEKVKERIKLEV